jgi:hypothetical protein
MAKSPYLKVNTQPIGCQVNSSCGRVRVGVGGLSLCMKQREKIIKSGVEDAIAWSHGYEGWVKTKLLNYICKKSKGQSFLYVLNILKLLHPELSSNHEKSYLIEYCKSQLGQKVSFSNFTLLASIYKTRFFFRCKVLQGF